MNNSKRLTFLRVIACSALLAGIVFSHELWFPATRTFPRAPILFGLPENFVLIYEWLFSAVLAVSLILAAIGWRARFFLISAIGALCLLIFFDQTRLQPWVYQYLLLFVVFALQSDAGDEKVNGTQTVASAQMLIAGLYVWSGIQKMNFTFAHETLPFLLAPVQNLLLDFQPPFGALGLCAAFFETLIGIGLLARRTRQAAIYPAVLLHLIILALLIAKNYNSIVWIWNAALILLVTAAFRRSDISTREAFFGKNGIRSNAAAKLIVAASLLLPLLNFFGWWDDYLSGALYSGSTKTAVIRVSENAIERLPATARSVVFQTNNGAMKVLPLFEWTTAELNVPVYPERRVFDRIFGKVCELPDAQTQIELIIKERPAIIDGNYKIARISCSQIGK